MSIKEKIGVHVPEVLLPAKRIDPHKWAVIACDQFTSQPEYWEKVAEAELGKQGTIEYLGIVTANAPQVAEDFLREAHARFRVRKELVGLISPVIGTHVGPGAVGFVYIPAKKS